MIKVILKNDEGYSTKKFEKGNYIYENDITFDIWTEKYGKVIATIPIENVYYIEYQIEDNK
jgi:hypothetical protein